METINEFKQLIAFDPEFDSISNTLITSIEEEYHYPNRDFTVEDEVNLLTEGFKLFSADFLQMIEETDNILDHNPAYHKDIVNAKFEEYKDKLLAQSFLVYVELASAISENSLDFGLVKNSDELARA